MPTCLSTCSQVCERHGAKLGGIFEDGRAECAAWLHAIFKKGANLVRLIAQTTKPGWHRERDTMNWAGTEDMNVTQPIDHIEKVKSCETKNMKAQWSGKVTQHMAESLSGLQCTMCRCKGDPCSWQDHWNVETNSGGDPGTWIRRHQGKEVVVHSMRNLPRPS